MNSPPEQDWLQANLGEVIASSRVLIVEDEALIALDLERRLSRLGCEVVGIADNHDDAVSLFKEQSPNLILMDISILGTADGIDTAESISRLGDVPVVFLTAYADDRTVLRATAVSPYGYLLKPFDDRALSAVLKVALWRHAADLKLRVLARAVSSATIGISLVEVAGDERRLVFANDAFCTICGCERESILGRFPAFPAASPDDAGAQRLLDAITNLGEFSETLEGVRGDGERFWVSATISAVLNSAGQVSHLLIFLVDTTGEKQAKSTLIASQQMQLMGQFSAMLTRNFNNILAVIQSCTDLAYDAIDDEWILRDLDAVRDATRSGTQLTRRLLEFTKGASDSEDVSADLSAVVRNARAVLDGVLGKSIRIDYRIDPGPTPVRLDTASVEQILMSLVGSARNAMPDGGTVTIRVTRPSSASGSLPEGSFVRLTVSDTGGGVSDDHRARIFDPLFATEVSEGEIGLGLYACRLLVERAGGVIYVESEPNHGTSYIADLPISENNVTGSFQDLRDSLTVSVDGATCLLVEDHAQLRHAYLRALRKVGFEVVEAPSARAALRAIEEYGTGLQLVVSEAHLPDMPSTAIIEAGQRAVPELPFIIIDAGEETSPQSYRAGVSTLTKPFALTALARKAIDSIRPTPASEEPSTRGASAERRAAERRSITAEEFSIQQGAPIVLLIDGDDGERTRVTETLRENGYQVVEASTHGSAVLLCKEHAIDLAVVGAQLPDADGFQTLASLRLQEPYLPVLITSADESAETVKRALRERANGFVSKPINPSVLLRDVAEAHRDGQVLRLQHKLLMSRSGNDEMFADLAETTQRYKESLAGIHALFQPIVRAFDGTIFGYEALMRSTGPFSGPMELLAASDALGRTEQLGRAMRQQIAASLRNNPMRDEPIFVNIHPVEFRAPLLTHHAEPLLPYASQIVLEVTERAQLTPGLDLDRTVAALREAGYRVALDDLGEGYAGLSWLVKLVPDVAKLDMSLVRDIHQSRMKRELVSSLVSACHHENTLVVAEGVETAEEARILRVLGCDLMQGYYFARPADHFVEMLEPAWPV